MSISNNITFLLISSHIKFVKIKYKLKKSSIIDRYVRYDIIR